MTLKNKSLSEKTCFQVITMAYIVIALFSLMAGIFTHSSALLLDGSLCCLDVVLSFITLFIVRLLTKSPTKNYQFGYFKLEPLVVSIQAAMTISLCLLSVFHSLKDIYHHSGAIKQYSWGFYYTVFTIILGALMCGYIFLVNKKKSSPLIELELLNWRYGLLLTTGLFIGFATYYFFDQSTNPFIRSLSGYIDPFMTLGIVAFIVGEPFSLFFENVGDLLDRKPKEPQTTEAISNIFRELEEHFHLKATLQSFKFRKSGRAYFCTLMYTVDEIASIGKLNSLHQMVKNAAKDKFPSLYIDLIPEIIK